MFTVFMGVVILFAIMPLLMLAFQHRDYGRGGGEKDVKDRK